MSTNQPQIIRTWVLVADPEMARLFLSYPGQQGWFELRAFGHPKARARGPRLQDSAAASPPVEDRTSEAFAGELAEHLERGLESQQYERLILVAPPTFLKQLRSLLSGPVQEKVVEEVDRNLASLQTDELEEQISEH